MPNKPRIWVDDPPDLWRHGGILCVRVHVKGIGFEGSLDLSPRTLRRLADNFYLAAEVADAKNR